jgi:hypothetical protein
MGGRPKIMQGSSRGLDSKGMQLELELLVDSDDNVIKIEGAGSSDGEE